MSVHAFVLSGILAGLFFALLRMRAPRWTFIVLGTLPPAWLLLASPALRVYGYHGFIQAGIVYQILGGNIPPASPLLAGQPGTYPWAGAAVLAAMSASTGVSPFWASAFVAISSLVVLLIATYRIGMLATGDHDSAILGTALSLYAFTFTQSVPDSGFKRFVDGITAGAFVEPRGAPILEKFNGCTAFPLGLALYAVTLLLLLRLATEGTWSWRRAAALTASLTGLAFVYPLLFPPMALLCGAAAALAAKDGGLRRRLAALLTAVPSAVALLAFPYYHHLGLGRADGIVGPVPLSGLTRQAGVVVVTFLPMLIVLGTQWRALRDGLRPKTRTWTLLLVSVGGNLALFTFVQVPLWSQYKYLLLAIFAAGPLAGVAWRSLHRAAWPVAAGLLTLFLMPFGLDCVHKVRDWDNAAVPFVESWRTIEPRDSAERDLYRWMRTTTHPRATFVDTRLDVPVFGRRSLYVALPAQDATLPLSTRGGDGYALDPRIILELVDGYPHALVEQRRMAAGRLLTGDDTNRQDVAGVAESGTEAYLVLRSGTARLAASRGTLGPIVFENAAAAVVALRYPDRPGGE
jgi:hypothetical protein